MGAKTPDGMWTGNLQLLAESAAYPKRLGEALLASWVQGSTAISISWSNAALGLVWSDPRTGVECSQAPALKKATATSSEAPAFKKAATTSRSQKAQSSELGPWGNIAASQPNVVESGSQGVQVVGPWSAALPTTEGSHASNQMVASSFSPWSSLASSSSSSSPFSPWESAMASKPANTDQHRPPSATLGPWGNAALSSSSEEDRDAEATPGQIGEPDHWSV